MNKPAPYFLMVAGVALLMVGILDTSLPIGRAGAAIFFGITLMLCAIAAKDDFHVDSGDDDK